MPSIATQTKRLQDAIDAGALRPTIAEPEKPPIPVADYPVSINAYSRGPLPASSVQQPDMQRGWQTGATPQVRLIPIGPISSPVIGAIAQSQAIQQIATTPVTTTSSGGSSTDVDLISAVNALLFGALDVSSFVGGDSGSTPTATNSVFPSTAGEVILSYRMNSNTTPPAFSAPWTALSLNAGAIGRLGWQKVTPATQVIDSYGVPGTQAWSPVMLGFASNATPAFTSLANNLASLPTTASVTITAGTGLLVFVEFAANATFAPNLTVSDSLGNTYVRVGESVGVSTSSGVKQAQTSVWYCATPVGGAGVTVNLNGNSATASTAYAIYQVTGLTNNFATYAFQSSDANKLVEFRGAVNVIATLPNPALAAGWQALASNNSAGVVTIVTAGPVLNNGTSSITVPPGAFVWLFSDGTKYWSTSVTVVPSAAQLATHLWLNSYNPFTGQFGQSQPAAVDLSDGTTGTGAVVLSAAPVMTGAVKAGTIGLSSSPVAVASSVVHGYDIATGTPLHNSNNGSNTAFTGAWNNVSVSTVAVSANTTADQNLMSVSIPAGTLNRFQRSLKIHCAGVYSTPLGSTATVEIKVKLGTLVVLDIISSANPGSVTNNKWLIDGWITTQSSGATGALEASGTMTIDLGALTTSPDTIFADTNSATVGPIDLTVAQTLQITIAFSAASASNVAVQRQMISETVN